MPAPARTRLDVRLVNDGLVASRERARALILAGRVKVDGEVVSKAGAAVLDGVAIEIVEPDFPWVGRGGVKLAHALDAFGIDVGGLLRHALGRAQAKQGWIRRLAGCSVLPGGLAEIFDLAFDVEHVVDDLERQAEP